MVLPRTIKNTPSSTAPQWLRDLVGNTSFLGGTSPTYSPKVQFETWRPWTKTRLNTTWVDVTTPFWIKHIRSMKLPNGNFNNMKLKNHTHTWCTFDWGPVLTSQATVPQEGLPKWEFRTGFLCRKSKIYQITCHHKVVSTIINSHEMGDHCLKIV